MMPDTIPVPRLQVAAMPDPMPIPPDPARAAFDLANLIHRRATVLGPIDDRIERARRALRAIDTDHETAHARITADHERALAAIDSDLRVQAQAFSYSRLTGDACTAALSSLLDVLHRRTVAADAARDQALAAADAEHVERRADVDRHLVLLDAERDREAAALPALGGPR
jgi:hypothetical protein